MKILLLGEYSNLHWTLAEGLRFLGHDVTVASDGDGFKSYPRDIDLLRKSSGLIDTFEAIGKVLTNLSKFKGYDIVQLINPCFTTLNVSINAKLYRYLKKNNGKVFLGAFGDDSFWLKACLGNSIFRYSEFYVGGKENILAHNERIISNWLGTSRQKLNEEIAETCDGIIACLCEYYMSYKPFYNDKLGYIPLPINLEKINKIKSPESDKLRFFIGINKDRSEFKGTDRLYNALIKLQKNYANEIHVNVVQSVPYNEYINFMAESHIVLDQLYSYSPAMNGLLAMSMGKILVGGGEPEIYELLYEKDNHPIVNVYPEDEDIYTKLENIILNKSDIHRISQNGRLFVEMYHDHLKVAQQYLEFWMK